MRMIASRLNSAGETVEIFVDDSTAYIVSVSKGDRCLKAATNSFEFAKRFYEWATAKSTRLQKDQESGAVITEEKELIDEQVKDGETQH